MDGGVLAVVVALLSLSLCQGLYFHIGETEQKCFIEEVPAETMIVGEFSQFKNQLPNPNQRSWELIRFITGKYKTQLFDASQQQWLPSSPGIGMHVEVNF